MAQDDDQAPDDSNDYYAPEIDNIARQAQDEMYERNKPEEKPERPELSSGNAGILQQIVDRLTGNGGTTVRQPSVEEAKKKQKQYGRDFGSDGHYKMNKMNKDRVDAAANTREPAAKLNAHRLKKKQQKFDKLANKARKQLNKPKVTGMGAKESAAQKALDTVDKLENDARRQKAEMKREMRTIKQQEAIAKAGPYGPLIAFLWGCKNWCLGHAVIICTVTGGLGYVVLKLTGAI
ncbi:MAG: hypothetical protein IKC79_02975 [Clostridia bacterium]|nr:hypothetical protein [Clostridia bacterium]